MMGHSHAVSGALLFAATAPYLPPLVMHHHLHPQEILMGTVLCAGAALLPDLDHHDGTIANFLGPVSKMLCRFVAWISGGHRHATHSLFFVAFMTGGTWAGVSYLGRPFTLGMTFFLLALAVRALNLCPPGHGFAAWGTIVAMSLIGTGVIAKFIPSAPGWLPYAVGLGCVAHLLGDSITKQGAPWLWPIKSRYEIVVIKSSGNKLETEILVPLMGIGTVALLWFTALSPHTFCQRCRLLTACPPGDGQRWRSREVTQRARRVMMWGIPTCPASRSTTSLPGPSGAAPEEPPSEIVVADC